MSNEDRTGYSLFALRLGVFIVMLVWTLDKFINYEHAAAVFGKFYYLSGFGREVLFLIGAIEAVIITGFVLGIQKRLTYGLVLIIHAVSTFSSYKQYLNPYEGPNLLFFAAWPMLAACIALYLMRDQDTKFIAGKR